MASVRKPPRGPAQSSRKTVVSSGSVELADRTVAGGLEALFARSLQRRAFFALAAAAGDDGVPLYARALAVECMPDGDAAAFAALGDFFVSGAAARALASGAASPRAVLAKLGLPRAEIRSTKPLSFACRCSAERAAAVFASLPEAERAALPPAVDVTCHLCGRTWSVATRRA